MLIHWGAGAIGHTVLEQAGLPIGIARRLQQKVRHRLDSGLAGSHEFTTVGPIHGQMSCEGRIFADGSMEPSESRSLFKGAI